MSAQDPPQSPSSPRFRRFWLNAFLGLAGVATAAGAVALLAAPILPSPVGAVNLQIGQVAPADVLAPRSITYSSQVLTEAARASAEHSVPDVFDPPDARIGRRQVELLHAALSFIDNVRADTRASEEEQFAHVSQLSSVSLDRAIVVGILRLPEDRWQAVKQEAIRVLDQVMRGQVREDRIAQTQAALPTLVTVELSETEAAVVVALVADFVVPNSLYNVTATAAARKAARDAVSPINQTFAASQTVISRGQLITAADQEALQQLDLLEPEQDRTQLFGASLAVLTASAILILFVYRFRREETLSLRQAILYCSLLLMFLLVARLIVPGRTVLPFLFPAATMAIMLTVIFGPFFAVTNAVILGALVGYLAGNSLELAVYASAGGVLAALSIGRAERLGAFLRAALAVALGNIVIILIFRLPAGTTDAVGLATLFTAGLFNGISATFSLPLLFVLGFFFDITTSLQLIELSRPNHPLLQFILRNAPGTYQHSLQVANLVEHAAERIGANPMLTRVGALYHDCGKATRPEYFVENQLEGENIHERLDPQTSASIVIGHVRDGLELARKHRLPSKVRDFIPEHHGTLRASFQYARAIKQAGGDESKVNPTDYAYPGPRPRSRETALLMLADACESASRANRPGNVKELDRLVQRVMDDRVNQGQLDNTGLTLNDLLLVRESFVNSLKGNFHARLKYPEDQKQAQEEIPQPAAPQPQT